MASALDEKRIGAELHGLMIRGDVTAPARVAEFFLPLIIERLSDASKHVDQAMVDTAVADTLLSYFDKPSQYDPSKLPLGKFLLMSARGDLKNNLARRAKEVERLGFTENVELQGSTSEHPGEERNETFSSILKLLDSETDKEIVTMMADGIRETEAYAKVLGILQLSAAEQKKIVKRHKDRLLKLLQRSRGKIDTGKE